MVSRVERLERAVKLGLWLRKQIEGDHERFPAATHDGISRDAVRKFDEAMQRLIEGDTTT